MAQASGSRHRVAAVAETVYGTTPATPAFETIRHTSCNLNMTRSSLQSNEIRSDRQLADFRLGQKGASGDIVVELADNSHDIFFEAALGGTWSTDTLKAGTTRKSFTLERFFGDITQYLRYKGMEINTMSISATPGAIATATFGFMGQTMDTPAGTPIAGATYPAVNTGTPYDAFSGVIQEGGGAIAVVTEVTINLTNNLAEMPVIGSQFGLQPSQGRSIVTGSVSAYFENATLLSKFVNETNSSLLLQFGGTGTGLKFELPKIKYTGGSVDVAGEGPVTVSLPFQALYDTTAQSNIVITRNAT